MKNKHKNLWWSERTSITSEVERCKCIRLTLTSKFSSNTVKVSTSEQIQSNFHSSKVFFQRDEHADMKPAVQNLLIFFFHSTFHYLRINCTVWGPSFLQRITHSSNSLPSIRKLICFERVLQQLNPVYTLLIRF